MVGSDRRVYVVGLNDFLDSRIAEAIVEAGYPVVRVHCGGEMGKGYRMDVAVPVKKNPWVLMDGKGWRYWYQGLMNIPFFAVLDRTLKRKNCAAVVVTDQRISMPVHWICMAKRIPYIMVITDYLASRDDYYLDSSMVVGLREIPQLANRENYLHVPMGVRKLKDLKRADAKRALRAKGHIGAHDKVVVLLDSVGRDDGIRLVSAALATRVKGTQFRMFILDPRWEGINDYVQICGAGSVVKVLDDPEWNVYASASDCFVDLDGCWEYYRILAMMVGSGILEASTRREEKPWGYTFNRESVESTARGMYEILHTFTRVSKVQKLAKAHVWGNFVSSWGQVLADVLG